MGFSWRRYTSSRKAFAMMRVEFRPDLVELVSLLAKWAYNESLEYDVADLRPPSEKAFHAYVRDQLHHHGTDVIPYWHEEVDEEEVDAVFAWARQAAPKMWPHLADDIRSLPR
ncbi:hypothetical protein ACWDTT_15920 [Streptosporangium sandarakinum]